MKKLYLSIAMALCGLALNAQNITFPDANLKARLIGMGYDTNGDAEIEQAEANAVTSLVLGPPYNITDLTGIHLFENLATLNVASQPVTSFSFSNNHTLDNLITINMSGCNGLVDFNMYVPGLQSVNLTNCIALESVRCGGGISTLQVQGCSNLKSLNCSMNQITSIDIQGLTNLEELVCGYNPLTTLDVSGYPNLGILLCSNSQLSSLNLSNLPSLHLLECSNNNLTSLNVAEFVQLETIWASNNNLTSLNVSTLAELQQLDISNNNFTNLDISGLANLQFLTCSNNEIEYINTNGCVWLREVIANNNNLTTLDMSDSTIFVTNTINLNDNPLETLFIKNGRSEILEINNTQQLQYICADAEEINEIHSQFSNVNVNSFCTGLDGNNIITGNVTIDSDMNGCTGNDQPATNFMIQISDTVNNGFLSVNAIGTYSAFVGEGTFTISPSIEHPEYFSVSPQNVTHTFNSASNAASVDFCITPVGTIHDVEVVLLPIIPANPGFDAVYQIVVRNKGNQVQSGSISLAFNDAVLDLVSATLEPSSIAPDNLTWTFTNLQLFDNISFFVTFNVNTPLETPAVNINDILSFDALVSILQTDAYMADNAIKLDQVVIGSFDPNDKAVTEGPAITIEQAGQYLHYLIRFQNTGTADAVNVRVEDILADNLDWSTFTPISASHTYRTTLTDGNRAEFIFENINLPAEQDDEPGSHGFISFKIKPVSTIAIGEIINNTAHIYFDFNAPIITNTVSTSINALGIDDFNAGTNFAMYPNPTDSEVIIINNKNIAIESVTIYNLLGQAVFSTDVNGASVTLTVSGLETGTYIIEIVSAEGRSTGKLIKK